MCDVSRFVEQPYAKTLENSEDGDIRKLSFEEDQEMRCSMLGSSSML